MPCIDVARLPFVQDGRDRIVVACPNEGFIVRMRNRDRERSTLRQCADLVQRVRLPKSSDSCRCYRFVGAYANALLRVLDRKGIEYVLPGTGEGYETLLLVKRVTHTEVYSNAH